MASMSRGVSNGNGHGANTIKLARTAKSHKVVKPKKSRNSGSRHTTPSSRNHRFQSFNERIASLKIDPIRRKRHVDPQEMVHENTHSHFGQSLEEWRDVNLSATFTAFAKEVAPLCDNLAMVLHNEDKLADLLVRDIQKGDVLAMEPLLNLLSHFAHDLDTRFEKHFQRAVAAVVAVAAKHSDVTVVEWSFTCLAWLFKYLSRLLTPDLRPLYDLMAPYLGKETQRPFVIRFTAEALSFLIRKTAVTYERDPKLLDLIMQHMLQDCVAPLDTPIPNLHQQGIMTLLTEALKGVQNDLNTAATPILQSLFKLSGNLVENGPSTLENLVCGVLTNLVHHCTPESFKSVLDTLVKYIRNLVSEERLDDGRVIFSCNLLFTAISVRKGTRISEWKPITEVISDLFERCSDADELIASVASPLLALLAVSLHAATVDAVLATRRTLNRLRAKSWTPYFLKFCDMFARLGMERFNTFVLPHFRQFVLEHADGGDDALFALIPRLNFGDNGSLKLNCRPEVIDAILDDLEDLTTLSDHSDIFHDRLASMNTRLGGLPHLVTSKEQSTRLNKVLIEMATSALQAIDENSNNTFIDFSLGVGLRYLLEANADVSDLASMWQLLCSASPGMVTLPPFWSNLLRYVKYVKPRELDSPTLKTLRDSLVSCLSAPSHSIRQDSLDIFQQLHGLKLMEVPDLLATAATIESIPIGLETSRSISMNIRKLASEYKILDGSNLLAKAAPSYCFGLLHFKLSQAWDDAIDALAGMSQSKQGEEFVMAFVRSWLAGKSASESSAEPSVIIDVNTEGFRVLSDFECPNLTKLIAIRSQVFGSATGGIPSLGEQLAMETTRISLITPSSRNQALKLLNKIPHLAEKRSRLLVPILLNWAGSNGDEDSYSTDERWARKDQKAMLAIFAQFVNPKVLYKSSEVYDALLSLCANGDAEIQRSALKAILAWKEPAVTLYEEHLNNLLDEGRFREELSVFLRDRAGEDDDGGIRPEHHSRVMPVLLRLIYGRAIAGGKEAQSGRRKAIFVTLSRYGEEILKQFLEIALPASATSYEAGSHQPTTPLRQQFGMLNMLNDMLQVLGAGLEVFVPILMESILACTVSASHKLDNADQHTDQSLLRSVRQSGMQCLVKIFTHMSNAELARYAKIIVDKLVTPRLDSFASENTQAVSASLRLISAWSSRTVTAVAFSGDGFPLLDRIAEVLQSQHSKSEVQLFVLQQILDNFTTGNIDEIVLQPHVSAFVRAIAYIIKRQPVKDLLDACVKSLSGLASHIMSGDEATDLIKTCAELLVKPSKSVSATTKTRLLQTLLPLVEQFDVVQKSDLYQALCPLFSRLQSAESRQLLSQLLVSLVREDTDELESAKVCQDMNAVGGRLDEADHERRERGFAWVYEHSKAMSLRQWTPIVHNCLFYIRDGEDRVNRVSASHALQLFIDAVSAEADTWLSVLDDTLLPGIERGMGNSSELVRAEYLAVLGHIIKSLPSWPRVAKMHTLAVNGDEEASFFANVLHIQQHRRLRALRRLSDEAGSLDSTTAARIFLPLLEHFVFDQAEGDSGRTLADQSVQSIGALAKALNRQAFRATFRRYSSYLKSKPDLEKTVLRLLGVMVDGIERDDERITRPIIEEQLPPLLEYLHLKDESTVDRRMPVAVTIVKLMLALPANEFASRLPAVLTDVSHVLRSRSQEARDQTRRTLTAISGLVGAEYFRFILKELRSSLQRGYQLHVLSFTVHSLLVDTGFEAGDLDDCLSDLMLVIMDDIFGITGQEKDAEEYKSGMKEVKTSKSFDTLELLARVTTVTRLGELIRPIRALLSEKLDVKMMKKADDLLTRLHKGLEQNPASENRDMLSFCWEIVNQVYSEKSSTPAGYAEIDERVKRYLVLPEAPKSSNARGITTSHSFKLIAFALDLTRKVIRRHEDLQTSQNMAGFLPMAGDALVEGQEEVKLSALRLLSTIMRVPLSQLDVNAPVYIKEAVALIKGATNMTTDVAKAALELITSVLREKRSVHVNEKHIALVLKRIRIDLDEPDRQGMIFRFLRAVLGRKIVITEVYEVMEEVGKTMVTSPDTSVRESARSAYLQFIMEYPQGKDRWQKQITFLVSNLQYEHAAGRKSVMEFLHQMVGKIGDDESSSMGPRIFVALLPIIIGDSDNNCREMARLLVGKLFQRVDETQLNRFLSMMGTWSRKEKKPSIRAGALQCWTILMTNRQLPLKHQESFRDKIEEAVETIDAEAVNTDSRLAIAALQAFSVLLETAPNVGFAQASFQLWQRLQQLPATEDVKLQALVAALLGSLFTDFAKTSSKTKDGLAGLPLQGSGGLELGAHEMRRLCNANTDALRAVSLSTDESLTTQIVRNLVFLGRCFDANGMMWDEEIEDSASEETETDSPRHNVDSSAIARLFRQLSRIIIEDKYSVIARIAALQCKITLINQLTGTIPNLQTVLRPLYALTDSSVPKPPGELFKALIDKAQEALGLIQKLVGAETYIAALAETRKTAKKIREERRQKRKIGAVTAPEKWERQKKRKHEVKKEKIKARGLEARGKRRGW